jgi:hypothetical protein
MSNIETTLADRPLYSLDALRIQAEIETVERSPNKRPTWAPAVVLDGELLELCHKVEYLTPDDKPVARLWAIFADPKRKGSVIRATYSQHVLPGIRCRGFELRAGIAHDGGRMTSALMDRDGSWSAGHVRWGHSDLKRMRYWASHYEHNIGDIRRALQPSKAPHSLSLEQVYERSIARGDSEERARFLVEYMRTDNAKQLARWEERERKKQNPAFVESMRTREADTAARLAKLQRDIDKEKANPDWRYRALTRLTELATARLLAFGGNPQIERERGAMVTGACYICGKTLTDKLSLERGIGPECIKHLRTFDLTKLVQLKTAMVAAHPDKGGNHEAFLEAYERYAEAKAAAEHSLVY